LTLVSYSQNHDFVRFDGVQQCMPKATERLAPNFPGKDAGRHWVRLKEGHSDPHLGQEPVAEAKRGAIVVRHIPGEIGLGSRVKP
jgi:hypothetical protein